MGLGEGSGFRVLAPASFAAELDAALPTEARSFAASSVELSDFGTHYVFARTGVARVELATGTFHLAAGMYAAIPGAARIDGHGEGFVATRVGYAGVLLFGGPIEARGRLRYIDGCTDSLLLAPPRAGDPCLNHLHIPEGTRQSRHTHPSVRVGMIARGRGRCVTPSGEHPLAPGTLFVLAPGAPHSFFTDDASLDVVVYHPDSDTGPTDEDHPMINRTFLTGEAR